MSLDRAGLGFCARHTADHDRHVLSGKKRSHVSLLVKTKCAPYSEAIQHKVNQKTGDSLLNESALNDESGMAEEEALLDGMEFVHADLMVPLKSSDDLVGILCLRDERMTAAYTSDEIAALMQVGEQLAITIANSRLFGKLKEIDRLATLGEMSAGLAHEIRNPLAAIKGAAQAIDPKSVKGDDSELLEVMVEEVNRLNVVVVEFLDYARPFRGTFAPVSILVALQKTVQLLKHDLEDSVELSLECDDQLPDINGDAEQLRQVFINLILNAADAIKRSGNIEIVCRGTDYAGKRFGYDPDDLTHIEIRISDNGPGIEPHLKDKVFIPFYTTKTKGTGLGLALCKRLSFTMAAQFT